MANTISPDRGSFVALRSSNFMYCKYPKIHIVIDAIDSDDIASVAAEVLTENTVKHRGHYLRIER